MESILKSKFFEALRVCDGVIRIVGPGAMCYLVEGNEKALLIDGAIGVGSLKAFVRELTELPVMAVITHGHMDHTGAAWEYKEAWMSPIDKDVMYSEKHGSESARFGFVTMLKAVGFPMRTNPVLADVQPVCPVEFHDLGEGDVFDLGGISLTAIAVPGHTKGSMVLLDHAHRLLFAGDACNSGTLVNQEESTTIQIYRESLLHLKAFASEFDFLCSGHDPVNVPASIIEDGITLCDQIIAGTDEAVPVEEPFGGPSFSATTKDENGKFRYGGLCNIIYKKEKIQ